MAHSFSSECTWLLLLCFKIRHQISTIAAISGLALPISYLLALIEFKINFMILWWMTYFALGNFFPITTTLKACFYFIIISMAKVAEQAPVWVLPCILQSLPLWVKGHFFLQIFIVFIYIHLLYHLYFMPHSALPFWLLPSTLSGSRALYWVKFNKFKFK